MGSEDEFTPVADARAMHERIPRSRLAVIDGAGHMPNLECPDRFNSVLAAFLASIGPETGGAGGNAAAGLTLDAAHGPDGSRWNCSRLFSSSL